MDLECIMKNEVSQREKKKYHILMYMKSRKIVLMKLFARKKNHRGREQTCGHSG